MKPRNEPSPLIRLVAALPLLALMTEPGFTQTAPAVSGFNGKLSYEAGPMNSYEGNTVDGSITFPVAHQFGFQADGLYSQISDLNFYGGAGHLFWRNPKIGLVGLTGGYLYRSGVDTYQMGVEDEYYWKRFTFGAFAGVGSIKYDQAVPFIDTNPTRFVGRVSAGYYPMDNLLIGASYTTAFDDNLVKGNIEYQTPIRGLALTGEAAIGDHGYDHLLFGIRYYFGGNKSLIDRHRQDDPPGLMQQILHGLGLYGAEYNRKGHAYVAANPGTGDFSGNYGSYGVVIISVSPPPIQIIQVP